MPDLFQHQSPHQTQQQTLSPQFLEFLKLLQLSSLELRPLVQEALKTNPALEEITETDTPAPELDSPDDNLPSAATASPDASETHERLLTNLATQPTLREHLQRQARTSTATPEIHTILEHLIDTLDENGFLTETPEQTAAETNEPLEKIHQATTLLQTFDPVGIAARNLQHSLLLQLASKNKNNSLSAQILRDHLPLLTHRKTQQLAEKLRVPLSKIHEAIAEITALDPAPARRFSAETNVHVEPDITLSPDGKITLADNAPQIRISENCTRLIAQNALNPDELAFLRTHIRDAKTLIHALAQRRQTLDKITRAIIAAQPGFLKNGLAALRPLTMAQVAAATDLHETTVSRAIAGKHIKTPHGLFPLRQFFTSTLQNTATGETHSAAAIREKIQDLIAAENPDHPLTDTELRKQLAKDGIQVARRTLAKYRDHLKIPPSTAR